MGVGEILRAQTALSGVKRRITMPKRADNLMVQMCTDKNLENAIKKSRKGKKCRRAIKNFDKDRESNKQRIKDSLRDGSYETSKYHHKKVYDPKERDISILPYNPDRVAQHVIINVLEPVFVGKFSPDSYACIKHRGIHAGLRKLRKALMDRSGTKYCLKMDVRHYYPSIDHDIMKRAVRRMIKDPRVLPVLDEIIDSEEGLPIGNYSSQYLANVYLDRFDHWIKEVKHVKYYFRYVDDIVILSGSKEYLHQLRAEIERELATNFHLTLKGNWQVFPVEARGIDFLGYVVRHDYVRLRKRTKFNIQRKLQACIDAGMSLEDIHMAMGSYYGWLKYANCEHLIQTLNNKANGNIFQSKTCKGRAVRQ